MFILAGLMAGCATPAKIVWDNPNSNQQDFDRDVYECTQQTAVSGSAGGTGGVGFFMIFYGKSQAQKQANELFKMCMRARGYTEHAML
jgi:galactokinase/mevalonate kinase-like predicted kinase